jgi:hypothetical protein
MSILVQFLLRLSFGLAVGMALTSPRRVSSGYYRNHLYVTLGLTTLAALAAVGWATPVIWLSAAAALMSYVGSVCWLYEKPRAGQVMLWIVAGLSIAAALSAPGASSTTTTDAAPPMLASVLDRVAPVSSGLVLGLTMAAMLLGHWYLNSPGMELAPLNRLLALIAVAVGLQLIVSGAGLVGELTLGQPTSLSWWLFVALRWLFGLFGVAGLTWMAWQTLKIPNTQSATGILYVAVIGVFVGELSSQLLSAESLFPL